MRNEHRARLQLLPSGAGQIIQSKLGSILRDADPLMPQKTLAEMQVQTRQMGHTGIAAMAISAHA